MYDFFHFSILHIGNKGAFLVLRWPSIGQPDNNMLKLIKHQLTQFLWKWVKTVHYSLNHKLFCFIPMKIRLINYDYHGFLQKKALSTKLTENQSLFTLNLKSNGRCYRGSKEWMMVWLISQTKLPNFWFSGRLVSLKSKFSCFRRAEKFPTPTRYTIDKLRCLNDQLLPNLTCPSITLIIHWKHVYVLG